MDTPALVVGTVLVERYGFDGMQLTQITRLTNTQAITASGSKYRLKDGQKIGDYGTAQIATPADFAEMTHRKLRNKIAAALPNGAALKRMTLEQLEALFAALPQKEEAK